MIRIAFGIAALVCLILSFDLLLRIATLGFAIGGWIGLKGYEQQITDAQNMARAYQWRLVPLQLLGGIFTFGALHRRQQSGWWLPVSLVAFPFATLGSMLITIGVSSEFRRSPGLALAATFVLVAFAAWLGLYRYRRRNL